ncbi:MAG: toll/interleukin-1 receptor domain-containing protein [Planctomycetota bacterium]|nr:toll/interleukin-1 receptor domain-containing protein [Planctomycetota bacterium]
MARTKIFISYSHKDEKWLNRLLVHLKPLEVAGITDVWADTKIDAGQKWRDEIKGTLAETKVAILLVSIDFINSDFIATNELPPLLKAAKDDGVLILQVIVGPCQKRFKKTAVLDQFQTFNDAADPLSKMSTNEREELWDRLADGIEDFLKAAPNL